MKQAHSKSPTVIAYEHKLEQLSTNLSEVREQLEQELLGLLDTKDLISLWKLRDVTGRTGALLTKSLGQSVHRVTEDMLEMVVQVERIIAHAQSQVERLRH